MMRPETFSEKALVQLLKKISKMSHFEIMHLIRGARETNYDLESKIDWKHQSFKSAKDKIRKDTNPFKKTVREFSSEVYH